MGILMNDSFFPLNALVTKIVNMLSPILVTTDINGLRISRTQHLL